MEKDGISNLVLEWTAAVVSIEAAGIYRDVTLVRFYWFSAS